MTAREGPGVTTRREVPARARGRVFVRDGRAPVPRKVATSYVMAANRATRTGPEETLRRALRRNGIRNFRRNYKELPGRPDFVLVRRRTVIFVHGCFWHRCPACHPALPKTHTAFWRGKFQRNVERDKRKLRELRQLGWRPLVVWECRLSANPDLVAQRIGRIVSSAPRLDGSPPRSRH
jgi:DNA mismatch endonuclease, patch repair protein